MNRLYKKFLPILFSLLLAASCLVVSVTAADEAVIAVEDAHAKAGETVDIAITMENNPGVAGMTLDVNFDSTVLTLMEVVDGGILGVNTHKPELSSPYTLSWSNDTLTENLTTDGMIATLRFTVNELAHAGDYPISLSYDFDNYDIYNVDIEPVFFKTVNGRMTVNNDAEPSESPTEVQEGAVIAAPDVVTEAGRTVEAAITVRNNPGIAGMTLDVYFDSSVLTLTSVSDGGILGVNTHKPELESPYTLSWSNDTVTDNYDEDGVIATLCFLVDENALEGEYPITLSYDYDNYDIYNVDIDPVYFKTVDGRVTVKNTVSTEPESNIILGDADGDGEVTTFDVVYVLRHVVSIDIGAYDETIMNADVDGNGEVEVIDATYMQRYLVSMDTPYKIGEKV